MSRIKVLAFLDNALGRDTEILLPVGHGLETYLNAEVRYKFIWDLLEIKLWNPDVLLLPNTRGHHMYVEAADYAYRHGITVLALDSEGNFRTDVEYDIWGYNTKKIIYQEWLVCWSKRIAKYFSERIDHASRKRIIVTGGSGFDRYSFGKTRSRNEVLERYNKNHFTRVIGYAGWGFGKLYNSQRKVSFRRFFDGNQEKAFLWAEEQRLFVKDVLRDAIETYPQTLFILKKHPKEEFEDEIKEGKNEMNELLHYENVLYLKNEEPIQDLISISDIWTGFETTTLFEAWMLNKPTILFNKDANFPRSTHYLGAIIGSSKKDINALIGEFYKNRNLDRHVTDSMRNHRQSSIEESIGHADGLNHLRVLYFFRQSIKNNRRKSQSLKISIRHLRLYLLMHLGRYFYHRSIFQMLPKFKKTLYVFENRSLPGFEKRKEQVYAELNLFHKKVGVQQALTANDWESLTEVLKIEDGNK